ncbi:MAG: putative DNA-binding domain-containing protein [Gammaproteobacteria bacterium]|nr:putative DNA-binding domain-containing protein [Gammaproteobacteria bacterium]
MKPDAVTLDSSQRLFTEMLDNQAADEPFISILENNPRIPGQVATDIYRNNTIGARKRALQAIYPVIEKVLGDSCFDMLAMDYVDASASMNSDLNLYGAGLPDFLQALSNNEIAFSELPYLKDLATLEWLYHKAYYAADDLAISGKQFADIDTSVKLERSRSLFCMRTPFPVYDIWQNHQGSKSVKEVSALIEEGYILIFRQQGHPVVQPLDRGEWSILQSVEGQTELDVLVQAALIDGVDIEMKLPVMIKQGWLRLNQCG